LYYQIKKVKSKVIYNDANPEWNQELKIGLKVKKKQLKFHHSTRNSYIVEVSITL
jgi:hypothetical protein